MSKVVYFAVVHTWLFLVVMFAIYLGLRRLVVQTRVTWFTACLAYVLVLALLPSVLLLAATPLVNYLFASGLVAPEPAWDVGLAMSLFISTWLCYAVGVLTAGLASWSSYKRRPNARADQPHHQVHAQR